METPALLNRHSLARSVVRTLHKGGSGKADLFLVDDGKRPFVWKDFGGKQRWTRFLGRIQIAREAAAYRWLEGVEGVPRLLGRPDPWSIAVEFVGDRRLADAPDVDPERLLFALRDLLSRVHARGVVHNDLRSRENLVLGPSGRIYMVDFAGAIRLKPGSWQHRFWFPILVSTDEAAYLRWKERLAPDTLSPEERASLVRFGRRRALWPFNRKGRRAGRP
jgi:predicted Ser/Thr protein kinase